MDYSSSNHPAESTAIFAGIGLIFFIIYFAVIVIAIAGMWKTFQKAGKPGWAAIIPFYNILIMIEIVGKPKIWLLWCLIPCVNFVFVVWLYNLISKSFGKGEGFTVGLVLLGFIFWPILGFGSAKYIGPSAAEANLVFGNENFTNPNNSSNQPPTTPQV